MNTEKFYERISQLSLFVLGCAVAFVVGFVVAGII